MYTRVGTYFRFKGDDVIPIRPPASVGTTLMEANVKFVKGVVSI